MANHAQHYADGGSVSTNPMYHARGAGDPADMYGGGAQPGKTPTASVGGTDTGGFNPMNTFRSEGAQNLDHTSFGTTIDQTLANQGEARTGQQSLAQLLMAQARGEGPNPAALQLQEGTEANARMAASQIASQRGLNPALAARGVMDATANINQQAAGQSGVLRAQQQLAAQGQLGTVLGQQRGQDLGLFGTSVTGQNTQNTGSIQNALGAQAINAGVAAGNASTAGSVIGGVLSGVAGAAGHIASGATGMPAPGGGPGSVDAGIAGGGITPLRQQQQPGGDPPQMASGGLVPGDSPKNDIVPAKLSPGEIVIPRSIAMAEDAPDRAAAFVRAIRRRKEPTGYGQVLAARRGAQ